MIPPCPLTYSCRHKGEVPYALWAPLRQRLQPLLTRGTELRPTSDIIRNFLSKSLFESESFRQAVQSGHYATPRREIADLLFAQRDFSRLDELMSVIQCSRYVAMAAKLLNSEDWVIKNCVKRSQLVSIARCMNQVMVTNNLPKVRIFFL